jgi:L-lactate dehydrogenase complex protein LldG
MSARADILERLGPTISPASRDEIRSAPTAGGIDRFCELAESAVATTTRVAGITEVPAAVSRYLALHSLVTDVIADDFADIPASAWAAAGVSCDRRAPKPDGDIYVGRGFAGIAENGAVVISSSDVAALGNAFLAVAHVVVLPAERVVSSLETFWDLLDKEQADQLPREFCFVSGPSRTGDLGLPVKLGAHGPAHVHIIIVDT